MVNEAEWVTPEAKVADFKQQYQTYSDEQLHSVITKWGEESRPERIAAASLLRERQEKKETTRHRMEMKLSKTAIAISILALLVALSALLLQWYDSSVYQTSAETSRNH